MEIYGLVSIFGIVLGLEGVDFVYWFDCNVENQSMEFPKWIVVKFPKLGMGRWRTNRLTERLTYVA